MVSIGIGFLQNFDIAMGIDISWPESFKAMFAWLEIFSLDFSVFGALDIMVRLTVLLTCLFAALVEVKTVKEEEVWLAVVLNSVAGVTLLTLIIFIGPARLTRGAIKWYKARKLANKAKYDLEKMTEEEARQMTDEEFRQFSFDVKLQIATKFPTAPVLEHYKGVKFGNEELRAAVKEWGENKEGITALCGHISGWDVSETTDMSNLFEDMKDFDEDISRWDVSNVQNMAWMFCNAEKFSDNIGSWNTANVQKCRACSWVLWLFL